MTDVVVPIVPLTDDQIAAIKELRFVWTNQARTVAFGLTLDEPVARRCPGGVTPTNRSTGPIVIEYDVMMGHPHAVELVKEIQDRLPADRHNRIGVT